MTRNAPYSRPDRSHAAPLLAAACLALASPAALAPAQPAEVRPPVEVEPRDGEAPSSDSRLLPEGAFLSGEIGRLERLGDRASAIVFNPDVDGQSPPPMVLLPSITTEAIEQVGAPDGPGRDAPRLRVSGQVFVYGGQNYLLPTIFQALDDDRPEGAEAEDRTTDAGEEAETPDEPDAPVRPGEEDEVSVESLIENLDEASEVQDDAVPPSAPGPLRREGGVVTLRTGRVVRGDTGLWTFAFDSGPEAEAADAPIALMPCRALERMEAIALKRGEDATFTVSGRVFLYRGRNYLLPTMFFVNRSDAAGLTSAQ